MSLREELLKAQKDAHEARIVAEKDSVDRACFDLAANFTRAGRNIVARVRQTLDVREEDRKPLRRDLSCATLNVTQFGLKELEILPGYRKLNAACRSPEADIQLRITVTPSGITDRQNNKLAAVNIALD